MHRHSSDSFLLTGDALETCFYNGFAMFLHLFFLATGHSLSATACHRREIIDFPLVLYGFLETVAFPPPAEPVPLARDRKKYLFSNVSATFRMH